MNEDKLSKALLAVNYQKPFPFKFDVEANFRHIVITRKTKSACLKEIKLVYEWHDRLVRRHFALLSLIEKIIISDVSLESVVKELENIKKQK